MEKLNKVVKELLYKKGASLVGFADLNNIPESNLPFGIAVAVKVPIDIIKGIHNGPTEAYYETYLTLNTKLDEIVRAGEVFLKEQGYHAVAQITTVVSTNADYRTSLPHKTVATAAGLGWIGKSALLVTKEFGSAVRLSSLLTDAPLSCSEPITTSSCGSCNQCTIACLGKAISGKLWEARLDRDELFNLYACRKRAKALSLERIGKEITLCGKCFEVCPYTKRYING